LALHRAALPGSGAPSNREKGAGQFRTASSRASTAGSISLGDQIEINFGTTYEALNEVLFTALSEAHRQIRDWKDDSNRHRPRSALGIIPLARFSMKMRLETLSA
jgi:transposase InsO family protein